MLGKNKHVFFQQLLVRPLAEDHFLYLCVEKYTYTHIHTYTQTRFSVLFYFVLNKIIYMNQVFIKVIIKDVGSSCFQKDPQTQLKYIIPRQFSPKSYINTALGNSTTIYT